MFYYNCIDIYIVYNINNIYVCMSNMNRIGLVCYRWKSTWSFQLGVTLCEEFLIQINDRTTEVLILDVDKVGDDDVNTPCARGLFFYPVELLGEQL